MLLNVRFCHVILDSGGVYLQITRRESCNFITNWVNVMKKISSYGSHLRCEGFHTSDLRGHRGRWMSCAQDRLSRWSMRHMPPIKSALPDQTIWHPRVPPLLGLGARGWFVGANASVVTELPWGYGSFPARPGDWDQANSRHLSKGGRYDKAPPNDVPGDYKVSATIHRDFLTDEEKRKRVK